MIWMPGSSYQGALPVATDEIRDLEQKLHTHVHTLSTQIGERNLFHYDKLLLAAEYIRAEFKAAGYDALSQKFDVSGNICENIEAEVRGTNRREDILVIGAHYDSVKGSPGANDNGTGIAAMLALARQFAQSPVSRTLRFVAFANEENNGDGPEQMGSYHYARSCSEAGDDVIGMISLEMLGCYSNEEGSQKYPFPFNLFYPSRGNFIGFVGNTDSRDFVHSVVGGFRQAVDFPAEGVAAPDRFRDINRSDHWAFWQFGYPALMATDTSNFRYEHLHTDSDSTDQVDFERMARVVHGIMKVSIELASS